MVGVMCMNSGVMSKVVEVRFGVCFLGSCVECWSHFECMVGVMCMNSGVMSKVVEGHVGCMFSGVMCRVFGVMLSVLCLESCVGWSRSC